MPETLDDTYKEIYDDIMALDEYDRKRADRAIMWVMCSERHLGEEELLDAIRLDTEDSKMWLLSRMDEKAVLFLCDDLLIIDPVQKV